MNENPLLPDAGHAAEFGPRSNLPGHLWTGTCGQMSLAVALSAAKGWPSDGKTLQALMDRLAIDMIHQNLAASNGAATLAALAREAGIQGGSIFLEHDYQEPLPFPWWRDQLRAQGGIRPIVLQVANGQALVDSVSGKRDEAGLRYHALAILGKDAAKGYVVADPDNPLANTRLQYYTLTTLIAARPCGLLMLNMQRPLPPASPPHPAPVPVPPPPPAAPSIKDILAQAEALLQSGAISVTQANTLIHEAATRL